MALHLFLAKDDASSSTRLLTDGAGVIDDLILGIKDLGGYVHSLAVTSGDYTLVGFVDVPDGTAAVAFGLTQAALGRHVNLIPAVAVQNWPQLISAASLIKVAP